MRQSRFSRGVKVPLLRAHREDLALSQLDLALKAGVGLSTVSRAERGEDIRLSSVRRLARALRTTPRRLQRAD